MICEEEFLKMKNKYLLILAIAALALSSLACGVTINGPDIDLGFNVLEGSGNVTGEERSVSGFNAVTLAGMGTLLIEFGEEEALTIEAEDNLIDHIETEVRGDTLVIGIENGYTFKPTKSIRYHLTVTDLTAIKVSGLGDVEIDPLKADNFSVGISGAGNVDIDSLDADSLDVNLSGVGNLRIDGGEVTSQQINISGTGDYDGRDLQSTQARVDVSGLGTATVDASEKLVVNISGAGHVKYTGHPSIDQSVSGVGGLDYIGE
jgi:hypothetical protein